MGANVVTIKEAVVGGRIMLRRYPYEGAVLRVTSVDEHGAATGRLLNPLVVDAEDYEVVEESLTEAWGSEAGRDAREDPATPH